MKDYKVYRLRKDVEKINEATNEGYLIQQVWVERYYVKQQACYYDTTYVLLQRDREDSGALGEEVREDGGIYPGGEDYEPPGELPG